jgi:hypothetical protein
MAKFKTRLRTGRKAELLLDAHFRKLGWYVEYKGRMRGKPCANSLTDSIILPDLYVFKEDVPPFAVEVKYGAHWSWNTFQKQFQLGIEKRQFDDYLKYERITGTPVWIYFLCLGRKPKNHNERSPRGLFCAEAKKLIADVDNNFPGNEAHEPSYFWKPSRFYEVCTYEEIVG